MAECIIRADLLYEQLYRASDQGSENEVKELLKKGVDPNSDYYNQVHSAWTPLHAASSKNRCNTVELLAKWGADIEARDCDGDTPLHCASRNCKNCVEMLLSCRRSGITVKNKKGKNPKEIACSQDIADTLGKYPAPPKDPLSYYPTFQQLHQLPEFSQTLCFKLGSHFRLAQEQRGSIRSKNRTAEILIAAKSNNKNLAWSDIVEGLLVNGEYTLAERVEKGKGQVPLRFAAGLGWLSTMKRLIQGFEKIDSKDRSPYDMAYRNKQAKAIKYLMDNQLFNDCLQIAVKNGEKDEIEFLLAQCNSDPNVKNEDGSVLLTQTQDSEIILLLLKHGARTDDAFANIIGRKHGLRRLLSIPPPDNPIPIFFVGEGGAGKSTVLKSLQSQEKRGKPKTVTDVDEKTVGIIPYTLQLSGKEFKCYDLAGQKEFHASHCPVLKNAIQSSPPIVVCCTDLRENDESISKSIKYWMSLVQNQCSDLEGKPHVIVIGSHLDELNAKSDALEKKKIFRPIFEQFKIFKFVDFIAMDCRLTNTEEIKQLTTFVRMGGDQFRSSDEIVQISASAQSFYIYLLDRFKDTVTVQVKDIHQQIDSETRQTQNKQLQEVYSVIPSTIPRLVEVCDQLNKRGLMLFIKNESKLENSLVICKSEKLLSNITGKVFAPENFHQHCNLATSTGVVPFFKFAREFNVDIDNLIAYMTLHQYCFEIKDKQVLEHIAITCKEVERDPDNRYFFFPGLIKLETPKQVWEEDPTMKYHFGWVIQASQDIEFFDPHCLQVLVLRLVFTFGLAPAATVQKHVPSLQRFCSVWKSAICWGDKHGLYYVELVDSVKCFVLKMRSQNLSPEFLAVRSRIINIILKTAKECCRGIETIESIIDPQQVVNHDYPLNISSLILSSISDTAKAVVFGDNNVKTMHGPQPLQQILMFEPYIGLDQDTLQLIHSKNNTSINETISDDFISNFANKVAISGNDCSVFRRILNPTTHSDSRASQLNSSRRELVKALETWRDHDHTEGTYRSLRDTLNGYSIFSDSCVHRSPLDLAGVDHLDCDPTALKYNHQYLSLSEVEDTLWEMRTKWYHLGLQLGIDNETLKSIETDNQSVTDKCLTSVLAHWLSTPKPTWTQVADALGSKPVDHPKLAKQIKEKYCSSV